MADTLLFRRAVLRAVFVVIEVGRGGRGPAVLLGLGVVEQRYQVVREVLDGAPVTVVARRFGVARQTVHAWLRRYAADGGLANLADRSSRPLSCPHQMPAAVEARVGAVRLAHPGWGPARIRWQLEQERVVPLPGRSSVYRALLRSGLIERRSVAGAVRITAGWERGRSMELWQMDVVGRVLLADGTELSAVDGLDDHSRFVSARGWWPGPGRCVMRSRRRCVSMGCRSRSSRTTGKVFTARFGRGPGPVLFDRICTDNGVRPC